MTRRHVTILGCAPGVPRRLPSGEVWYPNVRPRRPDIRRRLTRAFQIHPLNVLPDAERQWLTACPVPIYTIRGRPGRRFPLGRLASGPLSSTFDYMMALALAEGFTSILLAGIALQHGTLRERLAEHVSLAYWIGLARGQGVRVTLARPFRQNWLLSAPYRYGYDYWRERRWGQALAESALSVGYLDDGQAKGRWRGVRASGRAVRLGTPARD